ncbi:MAG: acyltransferase [Motiliproteus sp.]
MLLSDLTSDKNNNFSLIRVISAMAVLVSHSFALATGDPGNEPLRGIIGITPGHIAVDVFFITSGFLVTRSLLYRKDVVEFAVSRMLRIYPGLIVAVLFCLAIGATESSVPVIAFITDKQTWTFAAYNSSIFITDYQELPGVFEGLPFDNSVNGSLWTLPWEIRMYIILGILGGLSFISKFIFRINWVPFIIITIFLFSLLLFFYFNFMTDVRGQPYKLFRFSTVFFFGGSLYVLSKYIYLNKQVFLTCVLFLVFSCFNHDFFFVIYTLVLPYVVLYLAYVPSGIVRKYNAVGDYSYGIYIYAWPIQQLVVSYFVDISSIQLVFFSGICTLFMAYLSWNLIESRAMRMKKYFRLLPSIRTF